MIGVRSVADSPPDGYNFVITNASLLVLHPIGNPKLNYDVKRDLTNIAMIAGSPLIVVVNAEQRRQDAEGVHRTGARPVPSR